MEILLNQIFIEDCPAQGMYKELNAFAFNKQTNSKEN